MARTPARAELSGEAITQRVPRVLRWLADIVAASESGDTGYQLEAPTDLPMDEATFVAMALVVTELIDAASLDATKLRDMASDLAGPPATPTTVEQLAAEAEAPQQLCFACTHLPQLHTGAGRSCTAPSCRCAKYVSLAGGAE